MNVLYSLLTAAWYRKRKRFRHPLTSSRSWVETPVCHSNDDWLSVVFSNKALSEPTEEYFRYLRLGK